MVVVAADAGNKKAAQKLKDFAKKIRQVKFDIELITAKKAEAVFKRRVFNSGMNAEHGKLQTKTKGKSAITKRRSYCHTACSKT